MTTPISIGIIGAAGRLGGAIRLALSGSDHLQFAGGTDRATDADWAVSLDMLLDKVDVVIDVAAPGATASHVAHAAAAGKAYITGTTGLSADDHAALDQAANTIPVLQTGNFSLGVTVLSALVQQAAALLDDNGWDIELVESHHRHKVDSPSGTALLLGEAAARGRQVKLDDVRLDARSGLHGPRKTGDIGFASLRGGSVIGEHSALFLGANERIELAHKAEDRGLFARGALAAAQFIATAPKGRYDMRDVLKIG